MALHQVAARIEGDVFQGMIFWWHAAGLLRPSSRVARVSIENDQAAGVDDVSIQYAPPGIDAGGRPCAADYYQVKYHVDQRSEYSADSFCDPSFIKASRSLLQRFHDARARLGDTGGWHRLHLLSNWKWSDTDKLGPALRLSQEGALPDPFFTGGPRSALGEIREAWRLHLGLTLDDFSDFARRLRLRVDFLSRTEFRETLNERLINVGLREIPVDKTQNIYDSLTQQLIMNGTNSFDPSSFHDFCMREELFGATPPAHPPRIAIRSFMRCAEKIEDECSSFVCVADNFDGRHIRSEISWESSVAPDVVAFLKNALPSLRGAENQILLECHSSLAFLAGYELDQKSGARVFPVQKGVQTTLWRPDGSVSAANAVWTTTAELTSHQGNDVAIVVSVARDACKDVRLFVESMSSIGSIVDARPAAGLGPRAVVDANHAVALADSLAEVIRSHRSDNGGVVHLFLSVPNGLAFFLGRHRGALGTVQLYEFDFEFERDGSYKQSIRLPK